MTTTAPTTTPAQAKALRIIDREGAAIIGFATATRTHTVAVAPANALVRAGICETYRSGPTGETFIRRKR